MERKERRQSVPSAMGKDKLDNEHEGLSGAAREARRNRRTWEAVVRTGVKNFMRSKGMITMMEEHSSHVE